MNTSQAQQQLPHINSLASKIVALERRGEFLRDQIQERRGSEGAIQFSIKELEAIEAAVDALKYHRSVVNNMDNALLLLQVVVETQTIDPALAVRIQEVLNEYD